MTPEQRLEKHKAIAKIMTTMTGYYKTPPIESHILKVYYAGLEGYHIDRIRKAAWAITQNETRQSMGSALPTVKIFKRHMPPPSQENAIEEFTTRTPEDDAVSDAMREFVMGIFYSSFSPIDRVQSVKRTGKKRDWNKFQDVPDINADRVGYCNALSKHLESREIPEARIESIISNMKEER